MRQIVHRGFFYNSGSGLMKALSLLLTMAASGWAGEFAVLSTGFRLHADHHELDGATVRLYQKDGGYTQMDSSLVTAFEQEMEAPAMASAPVPVAAAAAPALQPREMVEAAARKNGLPPNFVHSLVRAE